ncbi:hypothetical protein E2C01_070196 [Portunus trituberculatus]|uniref:Uncharacterized protein n=1 Tax=Portunus trituberculatus TaxID=210409 RepID=A0A5B7HTJ3_PORTR|nr:hypothetical protein [Portunus trituberculatus]
MEARNSIHSTPTAARERVDNVEGKHSILYTALEPIPASTATAIVIKDNKVRVVVRLRKVTAAQQNVGVTAAANVKRNSSVAGREKADTAAQQNSNVTRRENSREEPDTAAQPNSSGIGTAQTHSNSRYNLRRSRTPSRRLHSANTLLYTKNFTARTNAARCPGGGGGGGGVRCCLSRLQNGSLAARLNTFTTSGTTTAVGPGCRRSWVSMDNVVREVLWPARAMDAPPPGTTDLQSAVVVFVGYRVATAATDLDSSSLTVALNFIHKLVPPHSATPLLRGQRLVSLAFCGTSLCFMHLTPHNTTTNNTNTNNTNTNNTNTTNKKNNNNTLIPSVVVLPALDPQPTPQPPPSPPPPVPGPGHTS